MNAFGKLPAVLWGRLTNLPYKGDYARGRK
jgi:hypothetical protein